MNCNNNQNNNNGCGCNCNPHPTPAPEPVDINMSVCDRNINMLPMLQTYTTKVLKPNIEGCCKKNILKQCMMNCENYKYVIKWDFDLNGETITVPENCILEFDGGSLKNGTIIGQDTVINNMGDLDNIFGENLVVQGTWRDHFAGGGGGGEPAAYIKDAEVSQDGNSLTLTKKDDTQVVFTPSGGGGIPDKPYDPEYHSGLGRKTLQLKDGGSNILTQDDFDQDNTIYVVPFDFSLGGEENISITFDTSTVSSCLSPLYRSEDKKLQVMQLYLEEPPITFKGVVINAAAVAEQTQVKANTPQYYYYQAVTVPVGKALLIDGKKFVVLNDALTQVNRYAGKVLCGGATYNIATVYPGTYTFKQIGCVTIPQNSILEFDGGSIDSGAINGNHTNIVNDSNEEIFKDGIYIAGTWDIDEIFDTWFEYQYQNNVAKNEVIENILNLTNDDYYSVINFVTDRNYLVELKEIPVEHLGGVNQNMLDFTDWLITKSWTQHEAPWVDDITLFNLPSNTKIVLESTITMLPCNQPVYRMFMGYDNNNITIEGNGAIYGDVHSADTTYPHGRHDYSLPYNNNAVNAYQGEYGHIFLLCGCKDVNISGITLSGAFGDNIMVWYGVHDKDTRTSFVPVGSAYVSEKVNIINTKVEWARRNGIAVAAKNTTIDNCKFRKNGSAVIYGTSPKAHIDFESNALTPNVDYGYPGYPEVGNENCIARDCHFEKYTLDDVYILDVVVCENYDSSYEGNSVTVENCDMGLFFLTDKNKHVTVQNCSINNLQYPQLDKKGLYDVALEDVKLIGCKINNINPMLLNGNGKQVNEDQKDNHITTVGCKFGSTSTDVISVYNSQDRYNSKIPGYDYSQDPHYDTPEKLAAKLALPDIGNILHIKTRNGFWNAMKIKGWMSFYKGANSRLMYVEGIIRQLDNLSFCINILPTGGNGQNSGLYKITPYFYYEDSYRYTHIYLSLFDYSIIDGSINEDNGLSFTFDIETFRSSSYTNDLRFGVEAQINAEIVNALPTLENPSLLLQGKNLCNAVDMETILPADLDKTYDGVVLRDDYLFALHNKKVLKTRLSTKSHIGTTAQRPTNDDGTLYEGFDYKDTDLNKVIFVRKIYTQETATTEFPAGTVCWMDGNGFSAALRKGAFAARPKARHIEEVGGENVFVGELTREDLGYEFFDLSLRKPIYANYIYDIDYESTHHDKPVGTVIWVDADGFTATIRRGTTAQRAALLTGDTTGLTPIEAECIMQLSVGDAGFDFFDTTLNKVFYLKVDNSVLSWVDAEGNAEQ